MAEGTAAAALSDVPIFRAPVILIFGAAPRKDGTPSATMRSRVGAALAFGAGRPDAVYLPTGGIAWKQRRQGEAEAVMMARLLREAGVPAGRITVETQAGDTFESARNCTVLLRRQGYGGPVAVVTSGFHMLRCRVLMWIMGWEVLVVPPGADPATMTPLKKRYWRVREVPAILWDGLLAVMWRGWSAMKR